MLNQLFLLIAAAHALSVASHASSNSVADIKRGRELIIATDPSSSPLNIKTLGGEYAGFEVDLAKVIAQEIGDDVRIVWRTIKWDRIPELVRSGSAHIGLNGIFVELHAGHWQSKEGDWGAYSKPYIQTGVLILARSRSSESTIIQLIERIPPAKVGAFNDPFVLPKLRQLGIEPRIWDQSQGHLLALKDGIVDFVAFDAPMVRQFIEDNRDPKTGEFLYKALPGYVPGTNGGYAALIRRESVELLGVVNRSIDKWRNHPDTLKKWGHLLK